MVMTNATNYLAALDALHHPAMTVVEEGLKGCWELRVDVHGKVLSGSEMADYVLWMIETFGRENVSALGQIDLPSMLQGGGISELGKQILTHADDADARKALASLYESNQESRFFLADQDISAGAFLRYFPAYWREDAYFELYYVYSGACPVFFEKERITLQPGSVLIVPPGVRKACCCPADDCCVHFFMLRKSTFAQVFWSQLTSQNLMAHFFRQALNGEMQSPYLRFEPGRDLRLESLLYAIYSEYNRNRKYSSQLLNALMSSFFLCLLQEHEETAQVSKRSDLRWKPEFAGILAYIQANYKALTLDELSARFGYSRRQLIRIIQNSTGSSFTDLQTRLRMEKAARMLSTRTASVDEIVYEIGFTDRTSFYRAFRKYYGCAPREYVHRAQDQDTDQGIILRE